MEQDSRLCIKVNKEEFANFSINRTNINIYNSIEVISRIANYIRNGNDLTIDSAMFWPDEPTEEPKICIVWNKTLGKIQFSVTGLTEWDTAIVCTLVNHYFCSLLIQPGEQGG